MDTHAILCVSGSNPLLLIGQFCEDNELGLAGFFFVIVNHPENIERAKVLLEICPALDSLRFVLVPTR